MSCLVKSNTSKANPARRKARHPVTGLHMTLHMTFSLKNMLAIVIATVVFFLLAVAPAVEASEYSGFTTVDDSTELVAVKAIDSDAAVHSDIRGFQRLPESLGGVIAKATNSSKVTTTAKVTPFGGAVGLASTSIRGHKTA
jgi:hypothetical protein